MVRQTHLTFHSRSTRPLVALLVIALAGCGSDPALRAGPGMATANPQGPPTVATDGTPADAEALRLQAEADVEAFLARQTAATTNAEPTGRTPIHWTGQPRPTSPVRAEQGPIDSPMATLGRPDDVLVTPPVSEGSDVPPPTAAELLQVDQIDSLMVKLSRELYQESAYADMPVRELLVIAALSVVRPERSLIVDHIPGLTDREREVLGEFQTFFRSLGDRLAAEADMDEVVTTAVRDLQAGLHHLPELTIATVALCYEVKGFGDYAPFGRNSFLAHTEQGIVIYMEIENFTSEINDNKQWVTELAQQLVIYSDRDGIPVWTADWQPAVDVSRNRRTDFFTVQVITLPTALSVGRYNLKLRVRDERSGAEAERSVQFEMVADPKLAARIP